MRSHVPAVLIAVSLVCGCFDSKPRPTAPAPNVTTTSESAHGSQSKQTQRRPAGSDRRRGSQGSARIVKDVSGLTPEKLDKAYKDNEAWQRGEDPHAPPTAVDPSPSASPE